MFSRIVHIAFSPTAQSVFTDSSSVFTDSSSVFTDSSKCFHSF